MVHKIDFEKFKDKYPVIFKNFFLKYFCILGLFSIYSFIKLLLIPADPKNAILWGFSLNRLFFLALFLFITIVCFILMIYARNTGSYIERNIKEVNIKLIFSLSSAAFIFSLLFLLTPFYRFFQFSSYAERLQPAILWLLVASGLLLIPLILIWVGWDERAFLNSIRSNKSTLLTLLLILAFIFFVFGFVCISRIGLVPDDLFWNENGIPILITQVLLSIVISIMFGKLANNLNTTNTRKAGFHPKNVFCADFLLFILIWVCTVCIWLPTPASKSYFAPGPYPPSNVMYPFSDAALYDVSAETALIGQGFANYGKVAKPLLTFFLFILHFIGGGDFGIITSIQVVIFATIPPLLFLFGKEISNRYVGLLAAFLFIFLERNAYIASLWLSTSHSKLIMSEIPLMFLFILFTYFMLKALKSSQETDINRNIVISGGLLGFTTLIRHNSWFVLAVAFFVFLIAYYRQLKRFFIILLLFFLGFTSSILPWEVRSAEMGLPFIISTILNSTQFQLRYDYSPQTDNTGQMQTTSGNSVLNSSLNTDSDSDDLTTQTKINNENPSNHSFIPEFIPAHFIHNIITSLAILPHSLQFHDLKHSAIESQTLFTLSTNNDKSQAIPIIFLWINLLILSIGLIFAWKKWGIGGLFPALLFVTYALALALARTSGGRYIVPIEWVILVYYAIGLITTINWTLSLFHYSLIPEQASHDTEVKTNHVVETKKHKRKILQYPAYILLFLLLGSAIPLAERIMPVKYSISDKNEILQMIDGISDSDLEAYSIQEIRQFVLSENSVAVYGRGLFPRFYQAGEGETKTFMAEKDYSRLTFLIISPQTGLPQYLFKGLSGVNLPLTAQNIFFPNESDVIVVGCPTDEEYIDAALVVVIDLDGVFHSYTRYPSSELTCPFKQ